MHNVYSNTKSTKIIIFTWKVSGGTVLANISNLDLSLNIFAVEAGDIWGIRNKRKRFATYIEEIKTLIALIILIQRVNLNINSIFNTKIIDHTWIETVE